MENVALVTKHSVFDEFVSVLDRSGYRCSHSVVRCADYGVPPTEEATGSAGVQARRH